MKYEYIGEQSITIHGNGEAGARMSEIDTELREAAKAVADAVHQLADVVSMPKQLPMPVHEAAKDALTEALVRFAAAIRRGSV